MAVKPSNAALTALRNTRREKQEELGRAYTAMGGSNTALLANPTIPKLERAINNLYQSAQSGGRETYGDLQAMSGTYNDVVGARTDAKLKNIKQESLGQLVSQPTIMGMTNNMYGNLTPEMQSAGITLDDLKKYNAGKSRRTYEDVANQIGAEHPVIATGLAAAEQPLMSLGNVAKNVRNYALGNPIENNFNPATALRQSVAENNIDTKVGNFAYGVGNSMVDMLIASLAGANAGPGIMGLEKADQVMNSAVDRGLTPNQIMAEGVGSGITTGLTEMIPFREFKAGDNILRSMRNEGIQEGAEDIADTLLDYIVTQIGGNPEKSELATQYQSYRDAGYSEEDAKNAVVVDYLKQLGLDSLAGAFAGGGMGAIGNVSQGYNAFTGRPRTNAEAESNVTADAEPETIPTLRDSRAEESAIQEQRNAELAQLTEAVAQMREQQNAQPINVYRGFNRSTNPLESNLARQQELSNFIPNLASNQADAVPLSYYTENPDVAREYARQNLDLYNALGEESYRALTGDTEIPVEGEMKNYAINPQNVFDITELGEKVDSNTLYNYLKEKLGPDFEKAFPTADYFDPNVDTADEGSMYAYQLLRNSGAANTGDTGTRFYNLLKNLGYDAVRYAEQGTNQYAVFPDVQTNEVNTVQAQPVAELRNEALENALRNREIAQQTRVIDSLKANLETFGNKSFNKRLDTLRKDIVDGRPVGDRLDNLVNEINEKMAGEEVGVDQRSINKDLYDDMKRVTDGYVIRVNDNMLNEMNLTLKQLNDMVNTTARDGVNHIRFVKGKSGSPIDTVYNEMYEQSGHVLPNPQSMAEGDLLKAVVDYVTNAKSGKNEVAQSYTWENTSLTDGRSGPEAEVDNRAGEILDKIARGDITEDEYNEWLNYALEKGKGTPEEVGDAIVRIIQDVSGAYRTFRHNQNLDEDLRNMQTTEELQGAVVDSLKGRRINLQMFSDNNADTSADTDEEFGRVETGRHKTSKAFTNTGSKVLTPHERKVLELDDSMEYEENSEKESMQAATDRLVQNGFENEYQRLLKKEKFNNVDVDEMFKLRRKYVEEALDLEARGQDATDSWNRAKQCFEKLQDQATDIGAGLQAYAKWSRNNTADGLLHQVTQVVNRFHNGERLGVMSRKEMKRTDFERQLEKLDNVKLTDEFVEEFTRIARQIEDMAENGIDTSVDERALEPMNRLGQMVDTLLPPTIPERVRSVLILNMLGNPRTLVTRNGGGNIGFNSLEDFVRKPVSYAIDRGLSRLTGKRTIARPTTAIYNAGREGFIYGLTRSVQDFRQNVHSARSGENNLQTAAVNNRRSFTDPILGTYERLVNFGLDVGDRPFYEKAYNMAIEEGRQLYEDGAFKDSNGNIISEAEFNSMNKLHAMDAGLEAVYQDDTLLSDAFLGFREKVGNLSRALFGVDIVSQFAMPFAKTPANIIYRWLEYSPFGLVKNAVQTIREVNARDVNNNRVGWREGLNQERFSKETARNIIGSALFYAFFNLARAGLFTGGYDDDDRVEQAQREAGMQEYALHTNNGDYDISWLPVLGGNAYSAAAVYDAVKDPNLTTSEAITKGISAGLGSQFSASMLQGLQRLFGASGYQNGTIAENILDTVLSGTSQVVPSLLRQVSAVGDQYQRNNYGPNYFDRYINSIRASIPWLRDDLQPRVSLTGEYREQNPGENLAEKIWSNMISPATHTVGTPDAVRDEALRLYEATGNTLAFQPYLNQTDWKSVAGELPDAETLRVYQENAYKAMNQAATQMINSDFYASLTDGEKESTLSQIYSAVNSVERANLLGSDKSNLSGAAKAYDEGSIEGLMNYVTGQSALATMDINNNENTREAMLNALENGSDLPSIQSQYQSGVERANTSLDSLMNNQYRDMLSTLSEESMTELRKNLDNAIKGVEFNTAVGNDKDYQEAQAAYNNGGVNGLAEYLIPAAVLKQSGMTNNDKNREMVLNAYNEGGMNAVNRQIQTAQTFSSTAYGENLTYRYDHATNYLPSLTPSQFATLYDTVDQQDKGTSGFNTISQQEVIDYLNQDPGAYDSNTALQYWNAFDQHAGTDDQWKKIPVLVNGHWEAKKA